MAWETFTSRDGIYAIDWGGVGRLIRSYVRSRATLTNTTVNEEFHWIGPTIHTLDVDWDKVRHQTDSESEMLLADFYRGAQMSAQTQIARLLHWVDQTRLNNAAFQKTMHDAQKQTMENIEKSVERAETGLKIARGTRDASAEFLMVSATMVSGGAALLAIGGGSALKATAKGQDDPNATKGTIAATFASEFAFGMVDLGGAKFIDAAAKRAAEEAFARAVGGKVARELEKKAAEKGTKLGLAILFNQVKGVAVEPTKAVIQGETFQEGLIKGQLKSVGGTHGEILKYLVLDDSEFPKLAAIADTTISLAADAFADHLKESSRGEKGERAGSDLAPKIVKPTNASHALLDALAYEKKTIEQMAVRKIGSAGQMKPTSWSHVQSAGAFRR